MGAPAHLAFSHVGIFVTALAPMVDFYTRLLGFTVTDRGRLPGGASELVFLSRDPDEHHQLVLATGRPRDAGFTTVNQISLRLPSLGDLRAAQAAVGKEPVSDLRVVTHGITWSVYFRDPEGNRIELFVDAPWYTPQPYAEPLDLSLPDDEILRRTEAECRSRPGFRTRAEWRAEQAQRMAARA